jgi:hypothetical protein
MASLRYRDSLAGGGIVLCFGIVLVSVLGILIEWFFLIIGLGVAYFYRVTKQSGQAGWVTRYTAWPGRYGQPGHSQLAKT